MKNKPKPKENNYGYELPEIVIKGKRLNKRSTFRKINDNPVVQTLKMFDPTGISSWPDVKYAYDDYKNGTGSIGNVALNVLGALPLLGKARIPASLFKIVNATRKQKAVLKILNTVTKVGDKVADVERFPIETAAKITDSATKPLAKTINKVSRKTLKFSDDIGEFTRKQIKNSILRKRGTPGFSTEAVPVEKITNSVTSGINTANFATDVNSAVNSFKNEDNKYEKGGWIQKATSSIKRRGTEGVCTGSKFGSDSCPPGSRRYNLAKTFKKMAKN